MADKPIPVGERVVIGDESGIVCDYMDEEGYPHVAVVEMHTTPMSYRFLDTTEFNIEKVPIC